MARLASRPRRPRVSSSCRSCLALLLALGPCFAVPASPSPPDASDDLGCAYYGDSDCPSFLSFAAQTLALCFRTCRQVAATAAHAVLSGLARLTPFLDTDGASARMIHVVLSVLATASFLLLLSQIFWRYRVHHYNKAGSHGLIPKSLHQWEPFSSSSSPRYCSVCRQLISGFLIYRNTGWACSLCQRYAHTKCLRLAERLDCKTPCLPAPTPHVFVQGNLSADATCCCCGLACSSNFGLDGLRCLWCNRTLHEECRHRLPSPLCDLGPFRQLILPPSAVSLSFSLLSSNRGLLRVASSLWGRVGVKEVVKEGFKEGLREMQEGVRKFNEAIVQPLKKSLKFEQRQIAPGETGAEEPEKTPDKKREATRRTTQLETAQDERETDEERSGGGERHDQDEEDTNERKTTARKVASVRKAEGEHAQTRGEATSNPDGEQRQEGTEGDRGDTALLGLGRQDESKTRGERRRPISSLVSAISTATEQGRSEQLASSSPGVSFAEPPTKPEAAAPSQPSGVAREAVGLHTAGGAGEDAESTEEGRRCEKGSAGESLDRGQAVGDPVEERRGSEPVARLRDLEDAEASWNPDSSPENRSVETCKAWKSRSAPRKSGGCEVGLDAQEKTHRGPVSDLSSSASFSPGDGREARGSSAESAESAESAARGDAEGRGKTDHERETLAETHLKTESESDDPAGEGTLEYLREPSEAEGPTAWRAKRREEPEDTQDENEGTRQAFPRQVSEALEKGEDDSGVSGKKLRLNATRKVGMPPGTGSKARRKDSSRTQMMYSVAKAMPPMASVWRLRSNPSLWFSEPQATPLLVFVNVKSGGQTGKTIYKDLVGILNPLQVIDIQAEGGPTRALTFFRPLAMTKRLRVLVCGGDGTVGWIIDSIHKVYGAESLEDDRSSEGQTGEDADSGDAALPISTPGSETGSRGASRTTDADSERHRGALRKEKERAKRERACDLRSLVPVGICPLGTGNDLSNVLGWGFSFDGDIMKHLLKIQSAVSSTLDLWKVKVTSDKTNATLVETTFSNYLDVGVAARIVLKFHKLREENPELFQSRLGNKFLYGEVGFRDFLVTPNIALRGLKIFCDGEEIALPYLEGICVVNIPSFAGGVELWDASPESWARTSPSAPGRFSPFPSLRYSSHDLGRVSRSPLPSLPGFHKREAKQAPSRSTHNAFALPLTQRQQHARPTTREERKAVEAAHTLSDPPPFAPPSAAFAHFEAGAAHAFASRSVSARQAGPFEAAAEEETLGRCCCCGAKIAPPLPRDGAASRPPLFAPGFRAADEPACSAAIGKCPRERSAGARLRTPSPHRARSRLSRNGNSERAPGTDLFRQRKRARHAESLGASSFWASPLPSLRFASKHKTPRVPASGPRRAWPGRRCVSEEGREARRGARRRFPDFLGQEGEFEDLPRDRRRTVSGRSLASPETVAALADAELAAKDAACARGRESPEKSVGEEGGGRLGRGPVASRSPVSRIRADDRKRSGAAAAAGGTCPTCRQPVKVSVSELSPPCGAIRRAAEARPGHCDVARARPCLPEGRTQAFVCGECCGCTAGKERTRAGLVVPGREDREGRERKSCGSTRKSSSCGPRRAGSRDSGRGDRKTPDDARRAGRGYATCERAATLQMDAFQEESNFPCAGEPASLGPQPEGLGGRREASAEAQGRIRREDSQRREAAKAANSPTRWRQQIINDQLIEVVGFKSLFHLGQVQVGLAKPVRICQGRDIKLILPQEIPLQIDGEPTMLQPETTMHITWNGETPVLLASDKSAQTQTLAAVQQASGGFWGSRRGLLSDYQFAQLAYEFQKRF
ncbi:hypothetical protein NCLIV_015910 [Neospora caninum Liverpool]|uniref:Diacylglycerol kinase n=1 Tax=Neospora caninum (strain Liverpool) TaxID=572307 RepID=F0VDK6_NEOCL|nr:hypothetical protein NCLIV_015910 [Neospora caninum Liverpool]CBZ51799.1 hypothetical protein NCLIV_015910 [Neospora caninum Liverpool]|eukprot:XP_003881832.1 hypothetical protein NCLIV_015910 [Neospora caninum Liverpool]